MNDPAPKSVQKKIQLLEKPELIGPSLCYQNYQRSGQRDQQRRQKEGWGWQKGTDKGAERGAPGKRGQRMMTGQFND